MRVCPQGAGKPRSATKLRVADACDGVHMETIQMILEHSNIGMTMNAWAQLMPDSQRLEAAAFDTILGKEAE